MLLKIWLLNQVFKMDNLPAALLCFFLNEVQFQQATIRTLKEPNPNFTFLMSHIGHPHVIPKSLVKSIGWPDWHLLRPFPAPPPGLGWDFLTEVIGKMVVPSCTLDNQPRISPVIGLVGGVKKLGALHPKGTTIFPMMKYMTVYGIYGIFRSHDFSLQFSPYDGNVLGCPPSQ